MTTDGNITRLLLGANLRRIRRARGLTQEELAEISGLSNRYIGRIERGDANPTLDVMMRLAASVNVGLSELLSPITTPDRAGTSSDPPDPDAELDTLRLSEKVAVYVSKIDEKDRRRLFRILSAFGHTD